MLDPARTASRTKKKKKTTSSPLIGAPVQSQDAKDARELEEPAGEADAVASSVLQACVEVHRVLGPGSLEILSPLPLRLSNPGGPGGPGGFFSAALCPNGPQPTDQILCVEGLAAVAGTEVGVAARVDVGCIVGVSSVVVPGAPPAGDGICPPGYFSRSSAEHGCGFVGSSWTHSIIHASRGGAALFLGLRARGRHVARDGDVAEPGHVAHEDEARPRGCPRRAGRPCTGSRPAG